MMHRVLEQFFHLLANREMKRVAGRRGFKNCKQVSETVLELEETNMLSGEKGNFRTFSSSKVLMCNSIFMTL